MSEIMAKKIHYTLLVLIAVLILVTIKFGGAGRYTFASSPKENWVIVGDTATGKSWECVTEGLYDEYLSNPHYQEETSNFDGCHPMMSPVKGKAKK